jgi:hypothetical protein
MNQKLVKTAEALGIDTKGKTDKELMTLISETWAQEKEIIEQNSVQEFIDNGKTRLPEVKKLLEKPFEIWIEKLQNGKKPECLQVVGFNPKTSSVIVCKETKSFDGGSSYKIYQVEEDLVIKSVKQLNDINAQLKAERKAKSASKPKKKK